MIKSKYLLLVILCFGLQVNSQNIWENITTEDLVKEEKQVYQKKTFPNNYKLLSLNLSALNSTYKTRSKTTNNIIELPDADGKMRRFELTETSNFEVELQNKYPDIRSYTAKGIDDPTATAKLSIGTDGFHGTIYAGGKSTLYIDPYTKDNKEYIVYQRADLPANDRDFHCKVDGNTKSEAKAFGYSKKVNDGKLRTYRLAIVCSGEYAQFHLTRQNISSTATDAAKKAAVLSAMNTSMTRINGVFEKDLGVRMVIVNNNDDIIFLDASTDNITDGNANTMINEVQSICDNVIGNANYDVGHIFSIGGDGLAGLGVVCQNGQKARGVTGISSPINDPYDIDYVAHELGHQFGATHTQNNNCNRTSSTAVEVGSGVTIMGYSGICAPNVYGVGDATGNSDDYFHAVSIAQMQQVVNGSGNCASLTDTDNATPTADAGLDYSIPKLTPFKLVGTATDSDGITRLTYNWEQIDNEVGQMPPSATNSVGPMFRSLPSKIVPERYFPELSTVVAGNTSSQWEVLPSVARDLNFAFTVRDNQGGGGSTARDDMKVSVTDADAFIVTSQESTTTWDTGSSETITWNVGDTNTSPISCNMVNIKLSIDGGLTFPILLKSNTLNDGSESIIIPDNATSNARIMVEAADNIFYNINSGNITINSTTPTYVLTNSSGDQSVCNTGNQSVTYNLNFDFVNGFSETVNLSASGNPQGSQVSFNSSSINSDGDVVMTVSNLDGVSAQNYTINVQGTSTSVNQNIDVSLQVTSASFNVLALSTPANNATGIALSETLTWVEDTNATSYDVQISTDKGFNTIVSSGNVTTNTYTSTNLSGETTYYWRVRPKNACGDGNYSGVFNFTTLIPSYCDSKFTDEPGGTEHITNVTFNTINNSSGNNITGGYEDFTAISTDVQREETYSISVTFNTGGYQDQCFVFIDWNGDFIFDANSEKYDLGQAFDNDGSSSTTNESTLSTDIQVPSDARLGLTRMRVFIEYFGNGFSPGAGACDSDHVSEWGETEDYSLNIQDPTATIDDVSFSGFNLFPNPNSGAFTLMFDAEDTKTTLELFDVRGRIVKKKLIQKNDFSFKEDIQFDNLSKGLYLLKIYNGNKNTTRKLIIE